ncbi:MAG: hypothetical protein JWO12_2812 [Frankiales bacterium]|nr:hypothetical protein [Frankiales bacterium]
MTIPSFTRTAGQLQSLVLTVLPHGGQHSARRNAWASMVEDNNRARQRREADVAMSRAQALSSQAVATAR